MGHHAVFIAGITYKKRFCGLQVREAEMMQRAVRCLVRTLDNILF